MMNILGEGIIGGSKIHKGIDKAYTYRNTPVYDATIVPAGRSLHIGGGVFRSACSGGCGVYADTWGGVYWIPELRHHEHDAHGLDVPGVNIGMLPK